MSEVIAISLSTWLKSSLIFLFYYLSLGNCGGLSKYIFSSIIKLNILFLYINSLYTLIIKCTLAMPYFKILKTCISGKKFSILEFIEMY